MHNQNRILQGALREVATLIAFTENQLPLYRRYLEEMQHSSAPEIEGLDTDHMMLSLEVASDWADRQSQEQEQEPRS